MEFERTEALLGGFSPPPPSPKVKAAVLEEARKRMGRSIERTSWEAKALPLAGVAVFLLVVFLPLYVPSGKSGPGTPGENAPQEEDLLFDRIEAFVKGDDAVRAAILKAGPRATLLLRDVRERAPARVDALAFEIKKTLAGPSETPIARLLEGKGVLQAQDEDDPEKFSFGDASEQLRKQVPLLYDPILLGAEFDLMRPVSLKTREGLLCDLLDSLSRQVGLDYGYFYGHVILSRPERLWPERPRRAVSPLKEEDARRARRSVEALNSDRVEEREAATRALKDLGRAVLPLLREELGRREPVLVARLKEILATLEPPVKLGLFGVPGPDRQQLEGADAKLRDLLKKERASCKLSSIQLGTFVHLLLGPREIPFATSEEARGGRVIVDVQNVDVWAILSLSCHANGCDFLIRKGALWFGTKEEVEQELRKGN